MAEQARVLKDFEGEWRVLRRISNADGPDSRFDGRAVWTAGEDGLHYLETGHLSISGHKPFEAERRYFWAPDLSVYFDDGRFFHQVPATGGATGHWCDPDQYDGDYDFTGWPAFKVQWSVKGPRKNYTMVSEYCRPDFK